jgi:hemerythrin superfamily protein
MTQAGGPGTTGEQDVVDVLTADHHEVTELLGQISRSTDPDRRRDLADTVIAELVRHSVAEEMFVYPAMREHLPDGDEAVEHDTREHEELERTMKELEGVAATDSRFDELLDQLGRILADHVQDEETEQFPQLRARVPRERLVTMAGQVEAAKQVAPTRPHPSAPNSRLFHLTVGPGVGLVDRLRDTLSGRSTES